MSKVQGNALDLGILRRMLGLSRKYRTQFYLTITLIIVLSVLAAVQPFLISKMIDSSSGDGDLVGLKSWFYLLIVLLVLEVAIIIVQTYAANWIGQQIVRDLRVTLFKKITDFRLKYFDNTTVGTMVTRVMSDIDTVNQAFSAGIIVIIGEVLKLVFILGFMFYINWKFTLIVLIPIPILVWGTNIFKNAIKKSFQQVRTEVSKLNTFVQEHIVGMNIVQIFNREKKEYEKFESINKRHRDAHIASIWAYSVFFPVVEILSAISIGLLIFWAVIDFDVDDQSTHNVFAQVVAFILYIFMLFRPIRQLADRFNQLQMGMVGAERVFKILDTEAQISETDHPVKSELNGNIEFKDVWFAYNEPDWILQGLSLDIKQGEMVAFVGATGAGKSTVLNLLSRFYEYQKGEILIDGTDIRSLSLSDLRDGIAVVMQDVFLFSGSILENITLNNPDIKMEDVIAASQAVGAHSFIEQLPDGYNFDVKERGAMLSAGQRQLISFIRAYLYQPKILILDEATSAVDTESEILIQNAQKVITKGRTSIVVAHRLSTVTQADRIIVLEKGKIIEMGNHQELLAKNGQYRKLYDLQINANSI